MYTRQLFMLVAILLVIGPVAGQNVGIGIPSPEARLHVAQGKSGASPHLFTRLAVESAEHTYINLLSPTTLETAVLFGHPNHAASGGIVYNNTNTLNGFQFRTGGNITRMIITSVGQVGINNSFPQATLDVAGTFRASSLSLSVGGNDGDFLVKQDVSGQVTHRKSHVGLGLNYIICIEGVFPNSNPPATTGNPYLGEIRLFAGQYAPAGWAFCHGQLLPIVNNQALFAILGTTFGGNGQNNFALPDLRGAVPVGALNGGQWAYGERSQ